MSKRTFVQILSLIVAAGVVYWAVNSALAWQRHRAADALRRQIASDTANSIAAAANASDKIMSSDPSSAAPLVGNDVVTVDAANAGSARISENQAGAPP